MFRSIDASISYKNLSMMVTCEHADSASSPTRLQSIGGGGKPGEPHRCNPNTLEPAVPKDPGVAAASPGAALQGTFMSVLRFTECHNNPPASSLS
jgi:hypothetical protein